MRIPVFRLAFTGVLLGRALTPSVSASETGAVSFVRDIAPVLQQKCVICHGSEKQKGGYRLDSFEWLRKAGDSGETPVTTGRVEESHLFALVIAEDEDDRMPQKDDPLPAEVIEKFRRWIAEGATFDGANPRQALADLIPTTAHPAPPELYLHAIPVLSLAVLEEGRFLALGGYHEVLIRELDSGNLQRRITNLQERIHALRPLKGGRQLLYAGGSPGRAGELGIIDLEAARSGAAPQVLARSTDTFLAVATSPDGRQVAVGGADKLIRVIDLETGREIRQLSQHADWLLGLAYSPDGSRLASASRDGTARVFDPASGEMISAFREHNGPVFDVVFVDDGKEVVSAGRDGTLRFWSADKGEQRASLKDLGGAVFSLTFGGEGLLAAVSDGSLREIGIVERRLGERRVVREGTALLKVATVPKSPRVIVGAEDGYVVVLENKTARPDQQIVAWPLRSAGN